MNDDSRENQVIDLDRALVRLGGSEEILRDLAALYLKEVPQWMTRLEEAVLNQNDDEIFRLAHDLKGSTDIFAAPAAVRAAQELERMGRFGELDGADEALGALKAELVWVKTELRRYLAET